MSTISSNSRLRETVMNIVCLKESSDVSNLAALPPEVFFWVIHAHIPYIL